MSRINDSWYTSNSDEWATPQALFEELDSEFHFVLDVCATEQNANVCNYYDKQIDGLKQSWNLGGVRSGAILPTGSTFQSGLKRHLTRTGRA